MSETMLVPVVSPCCCQCEGDPRCECKGDRELVRWLPLSPESREARELELGRRTIAKEVALEAWANSPQDDDALFVVYHESTLAYNDALRALAPSPAVGDGKEEG